MIALHIFRNRDDAEENSSFINGPEREEKEVIARTESVKKIRTVPAARPVTEEVNVGPVTSWKENRWILNKDLYIKNK